MAPSLEAQRSQSQDSHLNAVSIPADQHLDYHLLGLTDLGWTVWALSGPAPSHMGRPEAHSGENYHNVSASSRVECASGPLSLCEPFPRIPDPQTRRHGPATLGQVCVGGQRPAFPITSLGLESRVIRPSMTAILWSFRKCNRGRDPCSSVTQPCSWDETFR